MARMAKDQIEKEAHEESEKNRLIIEGTVPLTGIARTVQCEMINGVYKNFRILTLHLVNGHVMKLVRSDAWASFETMDRLDLINHIAMINLNNTWRDGECLRQ